MSDICKHEIVEFMDGFEKCKHCKRLAQTIVKDQQAEIDRLKAELQAKPVDSELVERLQEAYQNAFEHYGAHYNNLVVEVDMSDLHEAITALQQKPVENKND